jgi:hypothetical protein
MVNQSNIAVERASIQFGRRSSCRRALAGDPGGGLGHSRRRVGVRCRARSGDRSQGHDPSLGTAPIGEAGDPLAAKILPGDDRGVTTSIPRGYGTREEAGQIPPSRRTRCSSPSADGSQAQKSFEESLRTSRPTTWTSHIHSRRRKDIDKSRQGRIPEYLLTWRWQTRFVGIWPRPTVHFAMLKRTDDVMMPDELR